MLRVNHRLNLLLKYRCFIKLFSFFKLFLFYNRLPDVLTFRPIILKSFWSFLFDKQMSFFENFFAIHARLHHTTKFHKTLHIKSLYLLNEVLTNKFPVIELIGPGRLLTTSVYFLPLRISFFPLGKKLYKPFFLFLLFLTPLFWPTIERFFQLSNVFFYPTFNFKFFQFENSKIFRIQQL